jgi:SP family facilitated glucose transporter-like MFS transporter 3
VFYYSSTFFEGVSDDPLQGTTIVAFVNVLATYAALNLMDNTNRRTLILWSSGGMLVSTFFIIAALMEFIPKSIALAAVMAFVSFFEIGLGPIPWLIVAEMFDAKYVATAMSLACIVNWACNFLVGLLFPLMQASLGPLSFGPFAVVLVLTFLFSYMYLPETHGKSVEEIQRLVGSADEEVQRAIEIVQAVDDYNFDDFE